MASLIKVLDLYNAVATATGFPQYSNETDTPDTTRFLLEMLTEALHGVLDTINTNNSTIERTDIITTIADKDTYAINGVIKHAEMIEPDGKVYRVVYNQYEDFDRTKEPKEKKDKPLTYVIKKSQLRFFPTPDKAYKIKLVMSSNDIIVSDDDTYSTSIRDINDSVIGTEEFGVVIKLKAVSLIFTRCQNTLAAYYNQMCQDRLKTYIEHTYGSTEPIRTVGRSAGHYNVRRGLLG